MQVLLPQISSCPISVPHRMYLHLCTSICWCGEPRRLEAPVSESCHQPPSPITVSHLTSPPTNISTGARLSFTLHVGCTRCIKAKGYASMLSSLSHIFFLLSLHFEISSLSTDPQISPTLPLTHSDDRAPPRLSGPGLSPCLCKVTVKILNTLHLSKTVLPVIQRKVGMVWVNE